VLPCVIKILVLIEKATANNSWPDVQNDLNWFVTHGKGKKMYLSQNGWPSVTSEGVQNNSVNAVANVQNEHDYWHLLDTKCNFFKGVTGGGVGWFWHVSIPKSRYLNAQF
jgi:hypothetical protein